MQTLHHNRLATVARWLYLAAISTYRAGQQSRRLCQSVRDAVGLHLSAISDVPELPELEDDDDFSDLFSPCPDAPIDTDTITSEQISEFMRLNPVPLFYPWEDREEIEEMDLINWLLASPNSLN